MRPSNAASGVALWGVGGGVCYACASSTRRCRAQQQQQQRRLWCNEQFLQVAARVSAMRASSQLQALRLCVGVARGGARQSYNGAANRLFGELDRTHRAQAGRGSETVDRQLVASSTIARPRRSRGQGKASGGLAVQRRLWCRAACWL